MVPLDGCYGWMDGGYTREHDEMRPIVARMSRMAIVELSSKYRIVWENRNFVWLMTSFQVLSVIRLVRRWLGFGIAEAGRINYP